MITLNAAVLLPLLCVPALAQSLTGTWLLAGKSSAFNSAFSGTAQLLATGNVLSGFISINGSPCASGPIIFSGSTSGTNLSIAINEGGQSVTFSGTVVGSASISGTYISPQGGCTNGDVGTWTATMTSTSVTPQILSVVSAADYSPGVVSQGYTAVYGSDLSDGVYNSPPPYPTKLGNTEVLVCPSQSVTDLCVSTQQVFTSPTQINLLITSLPAGFPPKYTFPLPPLYFIARVGPVTGSALAVQWKANVPQIFTAGFDCFTDATSPDNISDVGKNCGLAGSPDTPSQVKRGTITDLGGRVIWSGNPAKLGSFYSIWLTGLGQYVGGNPPSPLSVWFDAYDGRTQAQVPANVTYSGEVSGLPGLYQINFQLPGAIAAPNGHPKACGDYSWEIVMVTSEGGNSYGGFYLPISVKRGDVACSN